MRRDDVTGFVLAGGKSTRMGTDKAAIALNGRTLLERAIATMSEVTAEVFILGSEKLYGGFGPVIEDIFPDCGPLGGIHAALSHSKTHFNLIVAVDTPFISAGLLQYLAKRAVASGAMVTTLEINGYTQPLCSVYSREFLPMAEAALRGGNYKIAPLFARDRTVTVGREELAQFAFTPEMLENLNTPQDLERARQRWMAERAEEKA
jgi:molybdopterin-guanine dinucleotide biosynthesis protein A